MESLHQINRRELNQVGLRDAHGIWTVQAQIMMKVSIGLVDLCDGASYHVTPACEDGEWLLGILKLQRTYLWWIQLAAVLMFMLRHKKL